MSGPSEIRLAHYRGCVYSSSLEVLSVSGSAERSMAAKEVTLLPGRPPLGGCEPREHRC